MGQVVGSVGVSRVEPSVQGVPSVLSHPVEFLGGSNFVGRMTTRLDLVSLQDTDECTPTPPARRGRGVLCVSEHPGLHGRMVDSSMAGGGKGVEGLGLRDMQSMLRSMAVSVDHMDSLTPSSHTRTLQI